MSNTYTQVQHRIIQDYAIALYMVSTDPDYPAHTQIKIDRINAVPIDFDNIFNFGLDPWNIRKLIDFALENQISNQVFLDYNNSDNRAIENLFENNLQ